MQSTVHIEEGRLPRSRTHLVLAAIWGAFAAFLVLLLLGVLLSYLLPEPAGKTVIRSVMAAGIGLYEGIDGVFVTGLFSATAAPFLRVLAFAAILVHPVVMALLAGAVARGLLRRRVWAEALTLGVLVLVAAGSAFHLVLPGDAFGRDVWGETLAPPILARLSNVPIGLAAAWGAWSLRREMARAQPIVPRPVDEPPAP